MTYRNRKVEQASLLFLNRLSKDLLIFPFNIISAITTIPNCVVYSYQSFAEKSHTKLTEVINFCNSYTGCTHNQGFKYIIMYNNSNHIGKERKLFTLAHEIGHIFLGHFNEQTIQHIAQNPTANKALEREANHFASCILCPTPITYKLQLRSALDIQQCFNISREAAEIAWSDYQNYDRNYHIPWHNDMIRLFNII